MLDYYVYEVDWLGEYLGPPLFTKANTDAEVYNTARDLAVISSSIVEVWDGTRLVWRLEPFRSALSRR